MLQTYAFLFSSDIKRIVKTPMSSGKYIEKDEVMEIIEEMQLEINNLKSK